MDRQPKHAGWPTRCPADGGCLHNRQLSSTPVLSMQAMAEEQLPHAAVANLQAPLHLPLTFTPVSTTHVTTEDESGLARPQAWDARSEPCSMQGAQHSTSSRVSCKAAGLCVCSGARLWHKRNSRPCTRPAVPWLPSCTAPAAPPALPLTTTLQPTSQQTAANFAPRGPTHQCPLVLVKRVVGH